jgi:putative ABC transport system ATP-binding protein
LRLDCTDLALSFADANGRRFPVLAIDRLEVEPGLLTVIEGPSGSGKSTLLYAICGLIAPDRGQVRWDDLDLASQSETRRDHWRRAHVGFVFQTFHLIDELDALGNVLLPVSFARLRSAPFAERARALLAALEVPPARGPVARLSRGEQQRVAFARALLFDPPVMLADEPTASLDAATSTTVAERLARLAHDDGRTVIAISHDQVLIGMADRVLHLERGRLTAPGSHAMDLAS